MQLFLVLALLLVISLVLFAVQNAKLVTLSFLAFTVEGSMAFILIVVFATGFLSGILASFPTLIRKGSALREQKRKVKQLERDIKTIPPPYQGDDPPLP